MNPRDAVDTDTGVRITVVPAQSAFFAGEDFKVIVTFSNTRSPSAPAKRSVSQTHKRAVHSISYAPLARPPTSPVTPRPAVPPTPLTARPEGKDKKIHARKGLIGDSSLKAGGTGSTSQVLKGKSMSVTISTQELAAALSASVASSLRDASFPANHPHARKHSVLDGQMQAELQLRELSSSPVLAPSGSGSVNNSAFSLSLDTIAEGGSQSEKHSYPPANNHGPNIGLGLGLGTPPQLSESRQPPRSAFATTFAQPGTELVLYAYAQLSGSLTLGNVQGESRAQSQALNAIRNILKRRQAIGGGSMEISSTLESRPNISPVLQRSRSGHGRSASLSSSLMSLISPPMPQHQPWSPGHKARSPSLLASIISPSVSSPAALNNSGSEPVEEVDPSTPLPIYDVQPAVLAVDLVLAPGESRSYTYTLPLPSHLPPTFRGRALKFTYHLTVGVCRARPSPSAPNGRGSTSQVMRVPIRIYNNVDVSMPYPQKPYDLLSPVLNPSSKSQLARVVETSSDGTIISKNKSPEAAMASAKIEHKQNSGSGLKEYAQRLLSSLSKDLPMMVDLDPTSPSTHREMDGGGELTGCREAVEILTRNMRKISYDVNKNGLKVAVLTFTKSAYRLGETVIGAVEINDLENRARVLKLSAMLEAHESLPSALCPPSSQSQGQTSKKLRKLHAEYHASLTPSVLRTSFALDIPSDASPAFQCECASPYSFSDSAREMDCPPMPPRGRCKPVCNRRCIWCSYQGVSS